MDNKLDFEKYGIGYLKGKNILFISEPAITKYLDALGKEDRSCNLPISPVPQNIIRLLSQSNCRMCGKCCIPNPLNPEHPGVEIFESELGPIAKILHSSRKKIKKETIKGKLITNPLKQTESEMTLRFPLPCPFFISESKECRVYPVRPVVCKIYPVLSSETFSHTEVKVNCDYGKDIVRSAIRVLRQQRPDLILLL